MGNKYVGSSGPRDARVFLLSQGPGRAEGQIGKPFVGPAGEQQQMYLSFWGLDQREFYLANLMKLWRPEDPKPNAQDIAQWGPAVRGEIKDVDPDIIAAVGGIAARWLLQPHYPNIDLSMDMIHGLCFPIELHGRIRNVVAIEHPASGIHSPRQKGSIWYDYSQLAQAINDPAGLRYVRTDKYLGNEVYKDCTHFGQAVDYLSAYGGPIAIDTEGNLKHKDLWSVQVSRQPGTGLTFRHGTRDFHAIIDYIQKLINTGIPVILHNAMFDVPMCRLAGLELSRANVRDTMYGLFTLGGYERLGLDYAGWRFCGRASEKFTAVVGEAVQERQLEYLYKASQIDWGVPGPQEVVYNDGVVKNYNFGGMNKKIDGIINDWEGGKTDKDGNPISLEDRFYRAPGSQQFHKDISGDAIADVESALGPFPYATLEDVYARDPHKAIFYASRDADITLDLDGALMQYPPLQKTGYPNSRTAFDSGMKTLPAFEECQATGVPCNRHYFIARKLAFEKQAAAIQSKIGKEFFGGKPFNVKSPRQTRELLEALGETGLEETPSGDVSTKEDSILHLQSKHEPIKDLFHARHLRHLATASCRPAIERANPTQDISFVHANWNITSIPTRRAATSGKTRKTESGFNLLAVPSRGEDSLLIRKGYQCPEGYSFVSADLSQIEPRTLTHFSQEPNLLDIYRNDRDWYRETGALMQAVPADQITKDERTGWKIFNLGLMYGFGGWTMMKLFFKSGVFELPLSVVGEAANNLDKDNFIDNRVRVTEPVCSIMIDRWYDKHPGVVEWKDRLASEVEQTGIIRDISGMPRVVPDIRSRNFKDRSQAERWIVSHKVQGSAQTLLQNSMAALMPKIWELRDDGVDVRLCLQYHDELVAICQTAVAPLVGKLIVWALTTQTGYELSVPIKAEAVVGKTWADLKD